MTSILHLSDLDSQVILLGLKLLVDPNVREALPADDTQLHAVKELELAAVNLIDTLELFHENPAPSWKLYTDVRSGRRATIHHMMDANGHTMAQNQRVVDALRSAYEAGHTRLLVIGEGNDQWSLLFTPVA